MPPILLIKIDTEGYETKVSWIKTDLLHMLSIYCSVY